ncbi:PSD1 and planctomycete cytochrome C domain-containing protein [Verrucomicrobia bacterium]|nr:PSD1 and planctomycete cytochrome C domain-containing protein [Verrucomicrobiota bacterium]
MFVIRKLIRIVFRISLVGGCIICSAFAAHAKEVSFGRDVFPILSDRCFACHGPDAHDRKAKLRLDFADGPDGAYRTHDDVTAIKPGSLEDSELWYRITTDDPDDLMPPAKAHKKPLTKEEQSVIKQWIEAGAPYERFWAFVPPKKPKTPKVKNDSWSKLPIDQLVLAKLESLDIQPANDADKRTLIRRVTFDLTGLPPTREEIKAFLGDKRPEAYEALVDRLLARKQYGEHMARYWLDLVRFADTNGMHKDFYRNFIAYRDWIIRAFNENLGYDDFVRYQLAGDLFSEPTNDQLVASGFNRLHLIIDRGTALPEESFFKNVLDRVTATGTTFMGMTVQCATCHDHKYDPLTQKDFYSLFAFFNNIDAAPETGGRPKNGLQPPFVALGSPAQKKMLAQLNEQLAGSDQALKAKKKELASEKDAEKKKAHSQELKSLTAKYNEVKGKRDRLDREIPRAMVMKERKDIRPTHIRIRGEYDAPGELVTRNTPEFLPALKKAGENASRMDLAEWFVQPGNPLTARVAANRFWQQFFGVGLVKTSEDLGAQGEVPSHPELLDHLAVSFVESGWKVKALIKQIVLTKTYRQSSVSKTEHFAKDPENRNLSRGSRFRMDAEMIRDQILATSGLLVNAMYGKSVKPPQPDGLWKSVTMIGERFKPDSGDAIYRRSLYTYWKRGMPPPQMTILNAPVRDACIARRERTNTPSQALLLLNEAEYLKAARELAGKTLQTKDSAGRLDFAYETVTSKLPDEKERKVLSDLVSSLEKNYIEQPALADAVCQGVDLTDAKKKAQFAAWTVLVNTLYNLDITKTRE